VVADRSRRSAGPVLGEILVWLLFVALLLPAGVVGWAIGRYAGGHTRTVTVSGATAAGSTAAATTAAATTAPATTSTKQTTASAAPAAPGPAKGKAVFASNGCGACHTFKAAGATATVGPDLDTKLAPDAHKAHMALAAFTRESIVKPDAYVSPGYPKGVMPHNFGQQLTKAQLAELVSFVAGGK
jgi:mono/diheme cytochrome c family protein